MVELSTRVCSTFNVVVCVCIKCLPSIINIPTRAINRKFENPFLDSSTALLLLNIDNYYFIRKSFDINRRRHQKVDKFDANILSVRLSHEMFYNVI